MNKIILFAVTLLISILVVQQQANALSAPTITTTGSLTGPSGIFQQVWTNSTHAFFFSDPTTGSINRWHYTFSTDTLSSLGSTVVSHGGVTCDSEVFYSSVQTDNTIYVYCEDEGTANTIVANYNINSLTKNNGTNFTFTGGDTQAQTSDIEVSQSRIYVVYQDENGASNDRMCLRQMARNYTSLLESCTGNILASNSRYMRMVVESGSPDEIYVTFVNDNDPNPQENRVTKWTTAGHIATSTTDMVDDLGTMPRSQLYQTDDYLYFQTTENSLYSVLKSDLTTTLVTSNGYAAYANQHVTVSSSTWSLNNDADGIYLANSTHAQGYNPSTDVLSTALLFAETITNSTGTITGVNEPKFYKLSDSAILSAPTTTSTAWTVREFTSTNTISPTAYSESLGTPLLENSRNIFGAGNVKIVCDAVYTVTNPMLLVGSDADCDSWRVVATSSATVGREYFPYSRTQGMVHTNPFTGYMYQVSISNPEQNILKSKYQGVLVDSGYLDAAGQLQQRYLYGQCYTIEIFNTISSVTTILGTICANDITTKTLNLLGVVTTTSGELPTGTSWVYAHSRNFTNSTNNFITLTINHSETPWNASVFFTDNHLDNYKTFIAWKNVTNANGATAIIFPTAVNGSSSLHINNNQTIYITIYDGDENPVGNTVVAGQYLGIQEPYTAALGTLFGINAIGVFVIALSGIFIRSNSHFGIIIIASAIGILGVFGMLTLPDNVWVVMIIIAAVGVFAARRLF